MSIKIFSTIEEMISLSSWDSVEPL
uniref:Uncharacterized protein n=1 Tax=Anguilla anguilla TaxID=7936 RepID=A0A0E9UKH9_ANGAN